jgi:hypothetical protein
VGALTAFVLEKILEIQEYSCGFLRAHKRSHSTQQQVID